MKKSFFSFSNQRQGFTLMELLVVIIIVAILTAVAVPTYFRSIENARMAEAEMWLGNVLRAQERYQVRRNGEYAPYWRSLDISPAGMEEAQYAQAASYCTKDTTQPADGNCTGNGFKITLYGVNSPDSGVVAQRVNSGKYSYKLARFYKDNAKELFCVPGERYPENDRDICAQFLGLDTYDPSGEYNVIKIEGADKPQQEGQEGGN